MQIMLDSGVVSDATQESFTLADFLGPAGFMSGTRRAARCGLGCDGP
jgi:hypothetical protein